MSYKIAFITSHFLQKHVEESLSRIQPDFEYTVVAYDDFTNITTIYDQLADRCDGFMVSGEGAEKVIRLTTHKSLKPLVAFQISTASLYKALLELCLDNRDQDLKRVFMDVTIPLKNLNSIADILRSKEIDMLSSRITAWMGQRTPEEIASFESDLIRDIEKLWKQKAFDLIICEFTNIIPALEQKGIPYLFPMLSDKELQASMKTLMTKIELNHLRSSLPACICFAPKGGLHDDKQKKDLLNSSRLFFSRNFISAPIEENAGCFCVEITAQTLQYFTCNGTSCMLGDYFSQKLDFSVCVGYGVGSRIDLALGNALVAEKEAEFRDYSYIVDADGRLIGPLGSERNMTVSMVSHSSIEKIANDCHLSVMTVEKLNAFIRLRGTNTLTSHDLSEQFAVTIRNASRILNNLEKSGYADITYTHAEGSKGRPVKVYSLKLE